jgi:hypothetical protein
MTNHSRPSRGLARTAPFKCASGQPLSVHRELHTWITHISKRPTTLYPAVVLYRRLVPDKTEASHRLSTRLNTHVSPHISKTPTTLCPPVVSDRRLVPNKPEASHLLSTELGTHVSPICVPNESEASQRLSTRHGTHGHPI